MNKSVKKWTLPKLKTLSQRKSHLKVKHKDECSGGFPGDSVVKSLPASAVDTDWIPGPGKSHMPQSS